MSAALSEHHGALSLFAEAIVGEPVPLEPVDDGGWPERVTDPTERGVRVPSEIDSVGESARRRYRAMVLHQVVGIEERSGIELDGAAMRRHHRLLLPVFAVLEDRRVVAVTRRRYPGGAADLDRLLAENTQPAPMGLSPIVELLRLRSLEAGTPGPATDPVAEALRAADDERSGVAETMRAAIAFCERLDADGHLLDDPTDDVDPAPEVELDGSAGASLDRDGTIARIEQRRGLRGGQAIEDLDEAIEQQPGHTDDDDGDDAAGGAELPFVPASRAVEGGVRTFVYDEWDFRADRHRPSWCRLVEERLEGDDHTFLSSVRHRHAELRADIRRRFARLRPEALIRVHRADEGDELDLDAILEAIADRRSGAPPDDRLHIRRDRAARDVATAFLVDLSASTSSPVEPPEPTAVELDPDDDPLAPLWITPEEPSEPPRRVIDVAKDAVALMSDALHELGDRHAIYGFSGTGRHRVEFAVAKDFSDRHAPHTWAAVSAMRPLRYTRMGTAVRHATTKLQAEAARSRLLIVISDGYPQDVDYGEDARDRQHGMHDTARALADAQRAGVDTFCITIDPAGHDYLREMCPDRRYLVIDEIEALPAELAKVYLALRAG